MTKRIDTAKQKNNKDLTNNLTQKKKKEIQKICANIPWADQTENESPERSGVKGLTPDLSPVTPK